MPLARQYTGQHPFQETWFVEALFSPDEGLWVRYVLDARTGLAEVWALVTTRKGVVASAKETHPLEAAEGPVFTVGATSLTRDRAQGRCGGIEWDLALDDRGLRIRHVPRLLPHLGVGRTYVPAIADLRVQGHVRFPVDGAHTTWLVQRGMGVLGHLWGRRSRVRAWAWAHCNAFDEEDVVFEGLSARMGPLPLTSVVLHAHGHTWALSGPRQLVGTHSRWGHDHWVFEGRRGTTTLTGELVLDPSTAATVRYDTAGGALFCTNTRFGTARIVLSDPHRGVTLDLRSREAAFELVGPSPRGRPIL
jgi:hypothetical protein